MRPMIWRTTAPMSKQPGVGPTGSSRCAPFVRFLPGAPRYVAGHRGRVSRSIADILPPSLRLIVLLGSNTKFAFDDPDLASRDQQPDAGALERASLPMWWNWLF